MKKVEGAQRTAGIRESPVYSEENGLMPTGLGENSHVNLYSLNLSFKMKAKLRQSHKIHS